MFANAAACAGSKHMNDIIFFNQQLSGSMAKAFEWREADLETVKILQPPPNPNLKILKSN